MTSARRVSVLTIAVASLAVSLVTSAPGRAQATPETQASAQTIWRGGPFPQRLTIYDRAGNVLRTLGEPGLYGPPAFSPDGTRLAVTKQRPALANPRIWAFDPSTGSVERPPPAAWDIWVFDLATGMSRQITSEPGLKSWLYVWSPDSSRVAYVANREGSDGLYLKPSDGTGTEQLLYRHTLGANIWNLNGWSPDGRLLCFDSGGLLFVLPLIGDRRAVELVREEYGVAGCRFSPDGRFLAYRSEESGRNEIYIRAFDPSQGRLAPDTRTWQVSSQGTTQGTVDLFWPLNSGELYYVAADGGVMAVEVTMAPSLDVGAPRLLFGWPSATTPDVSPDGQYIAFAVTRPPPARTVVTVAPTVLAGYAGTYAYSPFEWDEDLIVTVEDDRLMMQTAIDGPKRPLSAESESHFFLRNRSGDMDIEFIKDDKGSVTHLIRAGQTKWVRK